MSEIPYGYCNCGCGAKTSLAKENTRSKGHVCGEPVRYIHGHNPTRFDDPLVRLRSKTKVNPTTGCWEYQGFCNPQGYGRFYYGGCTGKQAHRAMWELHFGEIPAGLHVLHKCDNPPCVNPDHLFLGTDKDNADDREAKGRGPFPKGETHPHAKITFTMANQIRELAKNGVTPKEIASRFQIARGTIYPILRGERWVQP